MTFESETFANKDILIDALGDLGFEKISRGEKLELDGWDKWNKKFADIVIRRRDVLHKRLLSDIGFQRTSEGYIAVVDDQDLNFCLGKDFITRLQTQYHEVTARKMATKLGGTIHRGLIGKTIKIRVKF